MAPASVSCFGFALLSLLTSTKSLATDACYDEGDTPCMPARDVSGMAVSALQTQVLVEEPAKAGRHAEPDVAAHNFLQAANLAEPFWPMKNGNLQRNGVSPYTGPHVLSQPAWEFELPDVGAYEGDQHRHLSYGTPLIDAKYNVYIATTGGWLYSLDQTGQLRWKHSEGNVWLSDPTLVSGILYCASRNGFAFALSADTGEEVWRRRVTNDGGIPTDAYSILAANGTMIIPIDSTNAYLSNNRVLGLDMANGKTKWAYDMPKPGSNLMPAATDNDLIMVDSMGGMQRLALSDGSRQWYLPGPATATSTTGGGCLGQNGLAYVVYNKISLQQIASGASPGQACLRAVYAVSGLQAWEVCVAGQTSAAPSVGQVIKSKPLGVMFGYDNCVQTSDVESLCHSYVLALDAASGKRIWSFKSPQANPASDFLGPEFQDPTLACIPDHFTNSAIDSDGWFFINMWSHTMVFKDTNEDGTIDTNDPTEYSAFSHDSAIQGGPAIADNGLAIASCWKLVFFKA